MCAVESSLLCLEERDDVSKTTLLTDNCAVTEDEYGSESDNERSSCPRAFHCRTLVCDDRVLSNLLAAEHNNRPSADCFCSQTEVLPYMRDTVVTWMLEVLEEQKCDEDVFCLSVNYLDRVLCALPLRKTQIQLVASVCMLLASKFKDTVALPAERLVMYTDYSITIDQLFDWELLIVQVLQWNLSAVTPVDYVEQMLTRLSAAVSDVEQRTAIRRHSLTFIAMCTTDTSFMGCLPSVLAAASVSAAANGLLGHVWCRQVDLLQKLHRLIRTDIASLRACQDHIEQLLNNNMRQSAASPAPSAALTSQPPSTPSSKSSSCPPHPSTPTDVRDIRVCH